MKDKLPDVVWLSGQGNRLRDGQVDMGMCAYYRSDKAILKTDAGALVEMKDVNYLIRDLDIIRVILKHSKDAVDSDFLRIDRLQKFIREASYRGEK